MIFELHKNVTDKQIVKAGLNLARLFYKSSGCEVPEGFRFYDSNHPMEIGMWKLAVIAFEELARIDLDEALSNLDDEDLDGT